jgi:F0F1-type ATP synthase delta subunit
MEKNNEYKRYENVNAFIEMLSQNPDFSKYTNSKKLPRKQKANL